MDVTRGYQKHNVAELQREREEFAQTISKIEDEIEKEALEEGYSSRELEGPETRKNLRKWTLNLWAVDNQTLNFTASKGTEIAMLFLI